MHRTDTRTRTLFHLPPPATAIFDFSTPNHIHITVPRSSTWRTNAHWHTTGHNECERLEAEKSRMQVSDWKEPRTGSTSFGGKIYYFKPDYWTTWAREQNLDQELVVVLVVASEVLYRNITSAILDADLFPSLDSTPYWLRAIFALLWGSRARRWLIAKLLYVQIQAIYYDHSYWEYHGGINALSWWQWTHPFDVGEHPAWTVKVQFKSQRLFSRGVQALYHWVGRAIGMKGDYPEYNPRLAGKKGEKGICDVEPY